MSSRIRDMASGDGGIAMMLYMLQNARDVIVVSVDVGDDVVAASDVVGDDDDDDDDGVGGRAGGGNGIFFYDVCADDDVDVNVDDVSPDDVPGGRRSRYDDDDDDDRDDASGDVRATDGVCIYGSLLRLFGESYVKYADVRSHVRSDVGVRR